MISDNEFILYQIIENIARLSLFIPVFLYFYKKQNKEVWVLFYLLAFIFIHQIIYGSLLKRGSDFVEIFNSFYTPVEFLITSLYIRTLLRGSLSKTLLLTSIILYFICWIPLFSFSKAQDYISYIRAFSYSLILIFSLLYYYEQIRNPKTIFVYMQKSFWIVSGFFLFASGTFFIFLFDQFSSNVTGFFDQYVYIHALLFIVRNFFFSTAMIIKPEKSSFSDENSFLLV